VENFLEGKNFALKLSQWLKISYFYDSIKEDRKKGKVFDIASRKWER
jgi:hypothetical protein